MWGKGNSSTGRSLLDILHSGKKGGEIQSGHSQQSRKGRRDLVGDYMIQYLKIAQKRKKERELRVEFKIRNASR